MDAASFKKIVMPHYRHMFVVARAVAGNDDDAKDIVQDAVTRLWTKRDELDSVDNMQAYCTTIARRLAIDFTRCRHISVEIGDTEIRLSDDNYASRKVESSDTLSTVNTLIASLPERQRQVLRLRCHGECSMEEIAQITGLTEVNARSVLSRARQRLKELFTNQQI